MWMPPGKMATKKVPKGHTLFGTCPMGYQDSGKMAFMPTGRIPQLHQNSWKLGHSEALLLLAPLAEEQIVRHITPRETWKLYELPYAAFDQACKGGGSARSTREACLGSRSSHA